MSHCYVHTRFLIIFFIRPPCGTVSALWGAADAEIKVPSDENIEIKHSLLKPGVGQYIAIHATLTIRELFLAYFYPFGPFICIFSRTSPDFFPVLAMFKTGSCVGPQNKIDHLAGSRFPC